MGADAHGSTRDDSRGGSWWPLTTVAAIVWGIGVRGYELHRAAYGEPSTVLDSLYASLQLFVLESPSLSHPINGWIEAARWLALATTSYAAVLVASRMLGHEWARLRLRRPEGHTVVVGDGDSAVLAAHAVRLKDPNASIAVISKDDDVRQRVERSDIKAVSFTTGLDDRRGVRVHAAREVLITGERDDENLIAAVAVCRNAREWRVSLEPLVCHVQLRSLHMRESLRRMAVPAVKSHCYVRSFDLLEGSVRDLLSRRMPVDGDAGTGRPHVVVIGSGEAALAVVASALRLHHVATGAALRLTVATDDELRWAAEVQKRFPVVGELCAYTAVPLADVWRHQASMHDGAADGAPVLFALCPPDDASAVEWMADMLAALRGRPADVALHLRNRDLLAMLTEQAASQGCRVAVFGGGDLESWRRLLAQESDRERMAALAHLNFQKLAQSEGRRAAVDKALADWQELALEDYKESNRHQIDHLWVKLRAVQSELAPLSDGRPEAAWTHEEIERLSKMEHDRWVAERRLAGWRFAEGKKNEAARTNPNLVPWSDLSEAVRDYDRDAVRNIAALAASVGMKVCRIG